MGDGLDDDTVRFIITGDTQRSYDETIRFYKKVNSLSGVDFVIVAGDVTEFGSLKEMQWLIRELNKLTIPYGAVIGNHDLTMRGRDVFKRMYGELNYSFTYGGVKFICHDTNTFNPGFFLSYTFHEDLAFKFHSSEYPRGYYYWSPALRPHLSISNEVELSMPKIWDNIGIHKIGIYSEFNTNDFYIVNYFQNASSLSLTDVFQLGIGIRLKF